MLAPDRESPFGRADNQANTSYGFVGDPLRPIAGKYYGWLVRAGLY